MNIFTNPEFTIAIEKKGNCPKGFIKKDQDGFLSEIEKELEKEVKINVGYLKKVLNFLDDEDRITLRVGKENTPLHIEVKNKFKGVIAPLVEVDD